jgi:peptidoglycan hydrolase-like protein with peptidoglycan-binding domain
VLLAPIGALASGSAASPDDQLKALQEENLALRVENEQLKAKLESLDLPPYEELREGAKGGEVENLQTRLAELGFYEGKITGAYDGKTQKAVKAFQAAAGLASSTRASVELQALLFGGQAPRPTPTPTPAPTNTPKPTKTPKPTPRYAKGSYDKIARDPKEYTGALITFSGRVLQSMEDDDDLALRVATKGRYDNVIYVVFANYFKDHTSRILEGDKITVSGICTGVLSYEAVNGATITIPSLLAEEITVQ